MTSAEITNEMQAKLMNFEHEANTLAAREAMKQIVGYYNSLDKIHHGHWAIVREIKWHDDGGYEITETKAPNPFDTACSSH